MSEQRGVRTGGGTEPDHIEVQHILVGFKGSVPGQRITRTQAQAQELAYQLLEQARAGANFGQLVEQHTDDSPPGIYAMSNRGVRPGDGEYPRDGMVGAFGNVGFRLGVGEYGVADYDPRTSPYGYHVIKRVK